MDLPKLNLELYSSNITQNIILTWNKIPNATYYALYILDLGYYKYKNRLLIPEMHKEKPKIIKAEKDKSPLYKFENGFNFSELEVLVQAFNGNTPLSQPTSCNFDMKLQINNIEPTPINTYELGFDFIEM
jgi:hypothetical protein